LLHETLHCAFNHVSRRGTRDHVLANIAADFAINPTVASVYTLPAGALISEEFDHMSMERIYAELEKRVQKAKGGKGDPKEGSGRWVDPTPEQLEEAEQNWRRVVKNAEDRAKKAGRLPDNLQRLIEEMFPLDKISWRELIQDMARDAKSRVSTSWSRPNRRFMGHGLVLPGVTTDEVYRLVVCIDCSGSINEQQTKEMRAEVMSLLDQRIVTNVTMISTDTRVCNKEDVTSSEDVKNFQIGGGGGTDFQDCMKVVAEVPDAVGCIFLTDMQTSSFGDDPKMPVVWVNWCKGSNATAPYGRVTEY